MSGVLSADLAYGRLGTPLSRAHAREESMEHNRHEKFWKIWHIAEAVAHFIIAADILWHIADFVLTAS